MSQLELVADSRSSSSDTIRISLEDGKFEDFIGDKRFYYKAYVNEGVWTGDKLYEEERFLIIYRYDTKTVNSNGNLAQISMAQFRGNRWTFARAL